MLCENQDLSFILKVLGDACARLDNFCIHAAVILCHTCQRFFHRLVCELPEKHPEAWRKAEVKQYVPRLWTLSDLSGIFIFLMGCSYFTCPPVSHLLCNRLHPCVTAGTCVSDSTNPHHTCPHSFWHCSNTTSLLVGIPADKNVLCTIHHDCPGEHGSPGVAYPEKPAEPKTEPLLSANGFCLPLGVDLHNSAVSLTSPNCACIRETTHRNFNLEVTAR